MSQKNKKSKNDINYKTILNGNIFISNFIVRQTKIFILVVFFIFFYIANRYAVQRQLIEISELKKELTDTRYEVLTRSSELMEKSRQSEIEKYIRQKDSDLRSTTTPSYIVE